MISHTGVAGLTLGGGMGWLTRKAGLSIDNLQSAEVVTADGQIRRASAEENADLFWGSEAAVAISASSPSSSSASTSSARSCS
jgi:FAD/FMN-containing dehydrogenase